MGEQTKKKNLSLFLMILCLALPFLFIYYLSKDPTSERTQHYLERSRSVTKRGIVTVGYDDNIILKKNVRMAIGRTALVYTGLYKNTIHFDLYLLDLDPQQPYAKEITKREARNGFSLGDNRFSMVSVNPASFVIKSVVSEAQ